MQASGFIATKIRFKGRLAAVAIAISFLVIIIAVAVSAGFRKEIRAGVSAMSGDVILSGPTSNFYSEDDPVRTDLSYLQTVEDMDGVKSLTPAIYRAGIVKTDRDIQGVLVKGTSSQDSTMQVKIPSRLASLLRIGIGDTMVTYFVGEKVKVRKFTVCDIYDSLVDTNDNLIVYAPINDLQRLNGWSENEASVIEIQMDESRKNRKQLRMAASEIGSICAMYAKDDEDSLLATSAAEKYGQIYDWLDLIDFNVLAILILMAIVAGFNMISGLLILLFRHISTIGTLKAMGMGNKGIAAVFTKVSARIVLAGMVAGNAIGLLFCLIQDSTRLIKLNPENYFVSFVPVKVDVPTLLLADILAFAVIMLLTVVPCLFISKVDPSETVRAD